MHPALYSLFSSVANLKGIGPKKLDAYKRLGCLNLRDLVFHLPTSLIDRRSSQALNQIESGSITTQKLSVLRVIAPEGRQGKRPYKVECANDTGVMNLLYFHAIPDYMKELFRSGNSIAVSGEVKRNGNLLEISHPDVVVHGDRFESIRTVEPVYPLTYALTNRYLANTINSALYQVPELPEWLPTDVVKQFSFKSWKESLRLAHKPTNWEDISPDAVSRQRLAYDELFAQQLSLMLARKTGQRLNKQPLHFSGDLLSKLRDILPFTLTNAQERAINEISVDQRSEQRMMRLVQGDVGSGKTLVAFAAALNAIEAGKQVALMVPTEILARQHFKSLNNLAQEMGLKCSLIISALKTSEKRDALGRAEIGESNLIIGTHALFQEGVLFKNLGLVIIDEQHRFGVEQRLALVNKGNDADFMMMTATPIPRTLAMIGYGDLDVTIIDEKPANRKDIITSIISEKKIDELVDGFRRKISEGQRIYWVCPLIEESEVMDLANAQARFEYLNKIFPDKVGLVHGKLKPQEKDDVMNKFAQGELDILVATTVIEVGVDVPQASIIVIESAERFGLSQLHQLRGRVGRGERQSYCILMHKQIGAASYERLQALKDTNDGFKIAEYDLKQRGAGEVLGKRQSGLPAFRLCDVLVHNRFLISAHENAKRILEFDPKLDHPQHQPIKQLLTIFDFDKQLEYAKFN